MWGWAHRWQSDYPFILLCWWHLRIYLTKILALIWLLESLEWNWRLRSSLNKWLCIWLCLVLRHIAYWLRQIIWVTTLPKRLGGGAKLSGCQISLGWRWRAILTDIASSHYVGDILDSKLFNWLGKLSLLLFPSMLCLSRRTTDSSSWLVSTFH